MRRAAAIDPLVGIEGPARDWFTKTFPAGPTPAQRLAWPLIAAGENAVVVAPTGTGKTLAAFLAILSRLERRVAFEKLERGVRCVYISPLRSLSRDIERNLNVPLEAMRIGLESAETPVKVAVRTGDTPASQRRRMRDDPPQILITTPESLSLLLAQAAWDENWKTVEHIIVDEIHALVSSKRGADLTVSLERLAYKSKRDPVRIGLSATCRPAESAARFLVGPNRSCRVVDASGPAAPVDFDLRVESLIAADEESVRMVTYQRLIRRLRSIFAENRTTVVFANTRALTEKLTHDLRRSIATDALEVDLEAIAAHHSALPAERRRAVEAALQAASLKAVITSTSLELGVDIAAADVSVLIGLPGSVSRCLQRTGRAGHRIGVTTRGVMLASTAAELAGAAVTAYAARRGEVEPLRAIRAPLDVLCQQLVGMACDRDWPIEDAYQLIKRSSAMADLDRTDFDDCLSFLAGELASPAGAYEPEPGAGPRWTSARLWRCKGWFGVRSRRIIRWFYANVGTIHAEESVRVEVDGVEIGKVEADYADRLAAGDRFLLDGRSFEFKRFKGTTLIAKATGADGDLPRWHSDRQSLSGPLALALGRFRERLGFVVESEGFAAAQAFIAQEYLLNKNACDVLIELIAAQIQWSEIPDPTTILIEESPCNDGYDYAFHVPLGRSACEAIGRAVGARLGRRFGRGLGFVVADLGWSIRIPGFDRLEADQLAELFAIEGFDDAVLAGIDRGDLLARRFKHVASTALMVLRNREGGKRTRVGGMSWVSVRLFPLVRAACADHPLLRETKREVLDDLLDAPAAIRFLETRPSIRLRRLAGISPLAAAWIDPSANETLMFESPADALKRLHERLAGTCVMD